MTAPPRYYRDRLGDTWAVRSGNRLQLTYDNDPTWPVLTHAYVEQVWGPLTPADAEGNPLPNATPAQEER